MTYDELINALSIYSVDLEAVPKSAVTETNFRKALIRVKEILYKYKLHDLRKNPEDLPEPWEYVLIYTYKDETYVALMDPIFRVWTKKR